MKLSRWRCFKKALNWASWYRCQKAPASQTFNRCRISWCPELGVLGVKFIVPRSYSFQRQLLISHELNLYSYGVCNLIVYNYWNWYSKLLVHLSGLRSKNLRKTPSYMHTSREIYKGHIADNLQCAQPPCACGSLLRDGSVVCAVLCGGVWCCAVVAVRVCRFIPIILVSTEYYFQVRKYIFANSLGEKLMLNYHRNH